MGDLDLTKFIAEISQRPFFLLIDDQVDVHLLDRLIN